MGLVQNAYVCVTPCRHETSYVRTSYNTLITLVIMPPTVLSCAMEHVLFLSSHADVFRTLLSDRSPFF